MKNLSVFAELANPTAESLRFGHAPNPRTTKRDLVIGGRRVYPEINFTLPTMTITQSTMPTVEAHYCEMVTGSVRRAAEPSLTLP